MRSSESFDIVHCNMLNERKEQRMNYRTFWGLLLVFYVMMLVLIFTVNSKAATSNPKDTTTIQCTITKEDFKNKALENNILMQEHTNVNEIRAFLSKHNPLVTIAPEVTSIVFYLFPNGTILAVEYAGNCPVDSSKVQPEFYIELLKYLKGTNV